MATANFELSAIGNTYAFYHQSAYDCGYELSTADWFYEDLATAFESFKNSLPDNDFYDIELKGGYYEGASIVITEKLSDSVEIYPDDLWRYAYNNLEYDEKKGIYNFYLSDWLPTEAGKPPAFKSVVAWQSLATDNTDEGLDKILPDFARFIERHMTDTLEQLESKIKAFAKLYGGKRISGVSRFSNGEAFYNFANI